MPTFHDPLADAAEASEALRGLAHASRVFDDPADTYQVFGELAAGVRSLRQVLDQLAGAHLTHRDRAFDDDGNHTAGAADALAAADELHLAGTLLDQAEDRLSAAHSASGRIAWHREPAIESPVEPDAQRRWLNVVFLQGEQADQVLDVIDRQGTEAAIEHLRGFDVGEETTDAALENGYAYDTPPAGAQDRTITEGDYALTYNHDLGHVSLLRAYTPPPDPELTRTVPEPVSAGPVSAREAIGGRGSAAPHPRPSIKRPQSVGRRPMNDPEHDWFAAPTRSSGASGRGLSL
ncbi:hypothetical protein [Nesterenkonia ebinurensis]|uniref:hypothetical protein n=1 Tax=Nesterenkonia ebinurensis TaxID=2608252 RepID=UPI00123D8ED8|nr:hypothetical protein [Nesterenkonia ebinurensis]